MIGRKHKLPVANTTLELGEQTSGGGSAAERVRGGCRLGVQRFVAACVSVHFSPFFPAFFAAAYSPPTLGLYSCDTGLALLTWRDFTAEELVAVRWSPVRAAIRPLIRLARPRFGPRSALFSAGASPPRPKLLRAAIRPLFRLARPRFGPRPAQFSAGASPPRPKLLRAALRSGRAVVAGAGGD